MYVASLVYCGSLILCSPIDSDKARKGDYPHTIASNCMSVHEAD